MGKYHLPDGETLVTDLQCLVVYTPDDPVYRQALWGAISQLTKFWMWEPDGSGGEHDAADSWDSAYVATLESFGMLEELLGYVDDVEDLLRALEVVSTPCCDTDASGGVLFTDDVSDGTGDVPQNIIDAGYATDAADWAGFDDYKCMVGHIVVDDIAGKLRAFAPYVDAAGTIAGGIASIIGIISLVYTGGASALFGGILGSTAAAATLYKNLVSGDFLSTLANKVDANHDDLMCAIYDGTDGPDDACNSLKAEIDALFTTAEALVLKNLNICATIRTLYAGRYDLDNIAQILADKGYLVGDFTCNCDAPTCDDLVALPAPYTCFPIQMGTVTAKSSCGTPASHIIHQFEQIGDEIFVDLEVLSSTGCADFVSFRLECVDAQGDIDGFLIVPTSGVVVTGEDQPVRFNSAVDNFHGFFSDASMTELDNGGEVGGTVQTSGDLFDWMVNNYTRNGDSKTSLADSHIDFRIDVPASGDTRLTFSFVAFAITS